MSEPVVGLCRFSFVGRGDWVAWRGADAEAAADLRAETARTLYDPARMERRFWTYRHLLLESLRAQTDPDWRLIVLTSTLMPAAMQDRLRALSDDPRITVEVSGAADVDAGFLPVLDRLDAGRAVQFRIDDDDCLSVTYVARLQRMATAMRGFKAWNFSIAKGLVAALYRGEAPAAYALDKPYLGAGLASRLPPRWEGKTTIFGFGHFALMRRWQAIIDNDGPGHLILRLDDHDSERLNPGSRALRDHRPLDWPDFEAAIGRDFGFLDPADLRRLSQAD